MPKFSSPGTRSLRRGAGPAFDVGDPDTALDGPEPAERPPIWVEGRQAPRFDAMAFAEAGMLLTRAAAGTVLVRLSGQSLALSAHLSARAGLGPGPRQSGGRAASLAQAAARVLVGVSARALAARRVLFGIPDPAPTPAPSALPAAARRQAPGPAPAPSADPDLAAIRAVLNAPLAQPPRPEAATNQRPGPALSGKSAAPLAVAARQTFGRFLDWLAVRVLAGTVLAFATPFGYGRAIYRHLEGADLREIAGDALHAPRN